MTDLQRGGDDLQFDLRALAGDIWRRRFRIAFITVLLCILTFAILMFVPKEYESTASLLIEPRENIFVRATNDTGATSGAVADDVVVSSQVELIQSPDTLLRVVRDLDLAAVDEFSGVSSLPLDMLIRMVRPPSGTRDLEQIALARLQQKLTVIRQRDSRVVSILVRSKDKQLAARIANAIATAHVNRRAEQSVDDTAEASEWLQTEINKLRTRVSEAEARAAQFRIDNDLFVGPNNTSLLDQQMADISGQITDAQERRNTASSRANLIRGLLQSGQPIDGVPDVRESVVIQRLSENKATLQGELAQLSANLLDNHPDVQAVRAQIAAINNQIAIEGRNVAEALEAEAEIEANLAQSLSDDLTRLKLSAGNASTANVQLLELEREVTAQRDLLETYLARYSDAASRTDTNAALPDVRIITLAVPALSPASPKTKLILVAVLLVSLALQVGMILFRELSFAPVDIAPRKRYDQDELVTVDAAVKMENAIEPAEAAETTEFDETVDEKAVRTMPQKSLIGGLVARVKGNKAEAKPEEDTITEPPEPATPHTDAAVSVAEETEPRETEPREPEPQEPEPQEASGAPVPQFASLSNVIGDAVSGRIQTVMVLGLDHNADCAALAEQIIISGLDNGLSVALVDAGSGSVSTRPGMTDLSANRAEFGEVVQRSDIDGLSEVCWGTLPRMSRRSQRPATLVEALADIYEIIIVMVGTAGAGSNLQAFEGVEAGLVIAASEDADLDAAANIVAHAREWGFKRTELLESTLDASDVA